MIWDAFEGVLYVANSHGALGLGSVGKYRISGEPIQAALISGLNFPNALASEGGGLLFVYSSGDPNPFYGYIGTIGAYTTGGQPFKPNLITGVATVKKMVYDGSGNLYISRFNRHSIDVYNAAGFYTEGLISGLNYPSGLALDDAGQLYVVNEGAGTVGKYLVTGEVVNPSLIAGLTTPTGIALDGKGRLYVCDGGTANWALSRVAVYTTAGELVTPDFAPGIHAPVSVVVVPETSTNGVFVSIVPGPDSKDTAPNLIRIVHEDGSSPWTAGNVSLRVDGRPAGVRFEKTGRTVTLSYTPRVPFAMWSRHSVELTYPTPQGATKLNWSFSVLRETRDSVARRPGLFLDRSGFSPDGGGRSGAAGDCAANFPDDGSRGVIVEDVAFLNELAARDEITVSFWIKANAVAESLAFWGDSVSCGTGIQVAVPWLDGRIYFDTAGDGENDTSTRLSGSMDAFPGYTGTPDWWTTGWHFVVLSKYHAIKWAWIDGVVTLASGGAIPLPTDFVSLAIGSRTGGAYPLRGRLDDFAVYGTALSAESVALLHAGTRPDALPAGDRLAAYWDFNDAPSPPTLVNLADRTIPVRRTSDAPGFPVAIEVGDAETPAFSLGVTAVSSNPTLLPESALALQGSGGTRVLELRPAPGMEGSARVTVTVNDGFVSVSRSFLVSVQPVGETSTVASRSVYYHRSAWDGVRVDAAIALDKTALRPGQSAAFPNYTSYNLGLNGIVVDVGFLPTSTDPTAADFGFRVGNNDDPTTWVAGPPPEAVSVQRGMGVNGSDRIVLSWGIHAPRQQWLEVRVLATATTGLAEDDVFYFGNAVGDSGNSPSDAQVDLADEIGARNHPRTFQDPAAITDRYDFNRDARVDLADEIIARNHSTTFLTTLRLIRVSTVGSVATTGRSATASGGPRDRGVP